MRRQVRRVIGFAVAVLATAWLPVQAQAAPAGSQNVQTLFADASAKETAVRKVLSPTASPTLLRAVRTVVADYEALVRRFPSSAYCDDALWRAAKLSDEAFTIFGDPLEQAASRRLFKSLASQYSSSQFVRKIPVGALKGPDLAVTPVAVTPTNVVRTTPVARQTGGVATITAIRRVTLGQVVRVILELDREVSFRDERIPDPTRVFVDLPLTQAVPTLKDQTIRFAVDDGPVKLVRLGRHPNSTTRVVLEAEGISSYSVYPLYSPYRLVIDCLRADAGEGAHAATLAAQQAPRIDPAPVAVAQPEPLVEATRVVVDYQPRPEPPTVLVAQPLAGFGTPAAGPVELILQEPMLPVSAEPFDAESALVVSRLNTWQTRLPGLDPPSLDFADDPLPSVNRLPPPRGTPRTASRATTPTPPAPPATPPPPTPADSNLAGGFSMARQLGLRVSRVVIDPGHGGHDPGARGAGLTEAELVLDVSQRLAGLLAEVPGIEPILTRNTNEYIALQERTAIANRENADLFLSIHANASKSPQVNGVETYVLNFATNLSAAAVAARENAAAGQSMNALPEVVKTIALHNKLDESRDFAAIVQREMVAKLRPSNKSLRDLGVKQAPFVVLIGAAMPSVLAEIAFMTNPKEAPLLKSTAYRQKIAEALFQAVRKYQQSLSAATVAQQSSK